MISPFPTRAAACLASAFALFTIAGCSSSMANPESDLASGGADLGSPMPMTCSDGKKDGNESDLDCGGACGPCADGKVCGVAGDCSNGVCEGGTCKAPSCTDGVKNGDETDVDCGGSCKKCGGSRGCKVPTDCTTNMCNGGRCPAGPVMFGAPTTFGLGKSPRAMVVADFNGDRKIDIAVTTSDGIDVLLGKGDGTFGTALPYGTANIPGAPAAADFNKDGNVDLVFPNFNDNSVPVLLGKGDGTFTAGKSQSVPRGPSSAAIGDFDGDGRPDVALTLSITDQIAILLGIGDGTFAPPASYDSGGVNPGGLAVLDLDGDGKDDVAVANSNTNWMTGAMLTGSGNLASLLNDGTGKLKAAVMLAQSTSPGRVVAADLDGDGKRDIVATDYVAAKLIVRLTASGAVTTYAAGASPVGVAAADFTLDGKIDLAVCNSYSFRVTIFPNTGAGSFGAGTMFPIAEPNPDYLIAGDFNGDNAPDIAVSNIKYVAMPMMTYTPELDVILNTTM